MSDSSNSSSSSFSGISEESSTVKISNSTIITNTKNEGINRVNAQQLKDNWVLALMSRGIIVKIRISRWRGITSLDSDMLGLKFFDEKSREFFDKYVVLGIHKLLPPDIMNEFQRFDAVSRRNLENHSFDTVWGSFVPHTAFESWKLENERIKASYYQAAKNLAERYNEIVAYVREEYKNLAKDVWFRLYPDTTAPTESFINDFVDRVVALIPPKEDILCSFKYEPVYFFIPMPSFLQNDIEKTKEIQRESIAKDQELALEMNMKNRVADEYYSKKKELIDGFLEATVMEMRSNVKKLCNSVLSSIGKSRAVGEFSLGHINKINKMIKNVNLLNFYDDKEIRRLLSELNGEVEKFKNDVKGEKNNLLIVEKITEIIKACEKEIEIEDFNPALSYLEV